MAGVDEKRTTQNHASYFFFVRKKKCKEKQTERRNSALVASHSITLKLKYSFLLPSFHVLLWYSVILPSL